MPAMALLKDAASSIKTTANSMPIDAHPIENVASQIIGLATPMQTIAKAAAMPARAGTKAYYLQRLEREHPALAAKIASGEMSVYAASIAAGLRKAPATATKWTKADAYAQKAHA